MNRKNSFLKTFLKHPIAKYYLGILILLTVLCSMAPVVAVYPPNLVNLENKFLPMSLEHLLGTDYLGRDLLSRVLWGGRRTMGYAALVTAAASIGGTMLGMISSCFGGAVDAAIMKGSDILRSFPGIVLVLIVVSIGGVGIDKVCFAMLFTRWIWYARMARNLTRDEMHRTAITASRLSGSSWGKIILRHILPSIMPQMLSVLSIDFGSTLLAISSYSFLGLGVLPPDAEWGMMINDGRNYMGYPGMMLWPGICIVLVVISVNYIGDKIRDILAENRS